MPIFELYNADGTLQLNLASRLTKYLGYIEININESGSIKNASFKEGTPWYSCMLADTSFRDNIQPDITFSGETMTWSRRSFGSSFIPATVIYGVYSNGINT